LQAHCQSPTNQHKTKALSKSLQSQRIDKKHAAKMKEILIMNEDGQLPTMCISHWATGG